MKAVIFDFSRTVYNPDSDSLFPGIADIIEACTAKGYKLFLVAKGSEERRERIKDLGIEKYFEKIIVSPEKTKAEFDEILNYCEKGAEFYVLGDRVKKEIRFGNQCGMTTIWFKNGKFANEEPSEDTEKPNYTILDIEEIRQILKL